MSLFLCQAHLLIGIMPQFDLLTGGAANCELRATFELIWMNYVLFQIHLNLTFWKSDRPSRYFVSDICTLSLLYGQCSVGWRLCHVQYICAASKVRQHLNQKDITVSGLVAYVAGTASETRQNHTHAVPTDWAINKNFRLTLIFLFNVYCQYCLISN